jgi:hypothetical protein
MRRVVTLIAAGLVLLSATAEGKDLPWATADALQPDVTERSDLACLWTPEQPVLGLRLEKDGMRYQMVTKNSRWALWEVGAHERHAWYGTIGDANALRVEYGAPLEQAWQRYPMPCHWLDQGQQMPRRSDETIRS